MSSLTTLFSKMADPERHHKVLNSCMSKTLRHHFKGIRTNSHQNFIFMKLKLGCQHNRITNAEVEPLCGEVSEAELIFVVLNQHILSHSN
jgi:hypothetical protein